MAALAKALMPLVTTGIGAAVNRIQERQNKRYGNRGSGGARPTRSNPGPRAMNMNNSPYARPRNARNRRGRDMAVASRMSGAPVAQGVTSRTLPTQQVEQRAVEQFEVVAAPNTKFTAYYKTTQLLDELAFPRLSQICGQFQKFNPRALCYEYTPATSTSQAGTIYMGFDPDTNASLPTSSEQMRGLIGAVSGPAWKPLRMPIPRQLMSKIANQLYVRRSVSSTDNLNNVGKFIYAVEGITTTAVIGYLQIAYDISLIQPRTVIGANTTSSFIHFGLDGLFEADPVSPIICMGTGEFTRQTRAPILLIMYHPNVTLPTFTMNDGSEVKERNIAADLDAILLPFGTSAGIFSTPEGPIPFATAHALSPQEHLIHEYLNP